MERAHASKCLIAFFLFALPCLEFVFWMDFYGMEFMFEVLFVWNSRNYCLHASLLFLSFNSRSVTPLHGFFAHLRVLLTLSQPFIA